MSKSKEHINGFNHFSRETFSKLNPFKRRDKSLKLSKNIAGSSSSSSPDVVRACPSSSSHSVPSQANLSASITPRGSVSNPEIPRTTDELDADNGNNGGAKLTARLLDGLTWFVLLGKEATPAFPPAQSVFGGLYTILDRWQSSGSNIEALTRTIHRIERLQHLWPSSDDKLDIQDDHLRRSLNEALGRVRTEMEKMEGQSRAKHFFMSDEYARSLDSAVEDIRDALVEYQTGMMNDMKRLVRDMHQSGACSSLFWHAKLTDPLSSEDRPSRRPTCSSKCFIYIGIPQILFDGTRTGVLEAIDAWADDTSPEKGVFWLCGSAGCGKSTIAQTFAHRAFTQSRLGASFFCSRDTMDRSQLGNIFPTLALQLACRCSLFKNALLAELRDNPSLGHESLTRQCQELLVKPLESSKLRAIIVVDALDECRDNSPESAFLSVLAQYIRRLPNVKFFITGRPESHIRSGFRLASLRTVDFKLNDVNKDSVDRDIGAFLLSQLVIQRSDMSSGTYAEWPPSASVDALVRKADGLFIFAATTFKVISASPLAHPADQLNALVSALNDFEPEGQFGIDKLYLQILEAGIKSDGPSNDCSNLRLALGGVVLVFRVNPLTVKWTLISIMPNSQCFA